MDWLTEGFIAKASLTTFNDIVVYVQSFSSNIHRAKKMKVEKAFVMEALQSDGIPYIGALSSGYDIGLVIVEEGLNKKIRNYRPIGLPTV